MPHHRLRHHCHALPKGYQGNHCHQPTRLSTQFRHESALGGNLQRTDDLFGKNEVFIVQMRARDDRQAVEP
ncbi:hypothetical protein D3C76_1752810 [compost metagenome]